MATLNGVVLVFFGLFCLPANTKSANVIDTAVRYEDVVEVPQTNWTVKLVNLPLFNIYFRETNRKLFDALNITFLVISLYSNFVLFFEFVLVLSSNLIQNSLLLLYFIIILNI